VYVWAQPDAGLQERVPCGEKEKGKRFMKRGRVHGEGCFHRGKGSSLPACVQKGAEGIHEQL